ncbi:MAG: rod shape-determining protein MreC [Bacteroidetes bacterium]|nr:rod shape-determining protein MreC [Bacteroidota bacterium]
MVKSQNYHGSIIIKSTSQFSGSLNLAYTNMVDYFGLKKMNESLMHENANLKNSPIYIVISDSVNTEEPNNYIGARVVLNSTHKPSNYLMLNKGIKDDIKIDMGVVSENGIVGTVIEVSENYCLVMSVLNKNSKISAKIKKNNQLVNIVWNKIDYMRGELTDIPTHLQLLYGDSIITSGYSLVYPEGILIGTIESYNNVPGKSLNTAIIKFASNFNSLIFVYIINNLQKEEQLKLIEGVENE